MTGKKALHEQSLLSLQIHDEMRIIAIVNLR